MPMTYQIELTVPLQPEGVSAKERQIASLDRQIREVLSRKAMQNGELNLELKELRKQHNSLLDATENGHEVVMVDVYDRPNDQLLQMEVVRADTDEPIEELTRPLTSHERQLDFTGEIAAAEREELGKAKRKRKPRTEAIVEETAEEPAE